MTIQDVQYQDARYRLPEREHSYGSHIHLLQNPYLETVLANFSRPETSQPQLANMVRTLTDFLLMEAINYLFPRKRTLVSTRMAEFHSEGAYEADLLDAETRVVVVDLIRAGILPSQICYERLHDFIPHSHIRQDHILLNRKKDETGKVTGVQISGHKIGGSIDNAFVFFPDPMGATGGTLRDAIELYKSGLKEHIPGYKGDVRKFVGLHFIVTPEFLETMKDLKDDVEIFALRLDRGLSSPEVLKKPLGEDWKNERGLNDQQYIVPGAGGIGELLNNSFDE